MEPFKRQQLQPFQLPTRVVEKWSREVLDEGFVPFPKKFLRTLPQLFSGSTGIEDLTALLAVVDFRRVDQSRHPSLEFLAFVAGMEPDDYRAALTRLESKHFVSITRHPEDAGLEIRLEGLLSRILELTQTEELPPPPPSRSSSPPPTNSSTKPFAG